MWFTHIFCEPVAYFFILFTWVFVDKKFLILIRFNLSILWLERGFPGGSDSKESACNAGELGSILGSGRSPGEGNGYPLQCSCLENSMDHSTPGFLSFTISPGQPVAMVRAESSLFHMTPGWRTSPTVASSSRGAGELFSSGCPPISLGSSQRLQQGLCPGPGRDIGWHVDQHPALVKVYTLKRATSGTARVPGVSSGYMEQLKGISLLVRAWQNVVHWRRQWKTSILALRTPWTVWKKFVT